MKRTGTFVSAVGRHSVSNRVSVTKHSSVTRFETDPEHDCEKKMWE